MPTKSWFGLVSLFPDMFKNIAEEGVFGRAVKSGLLELAHFNPRDFTHDKHRTVDDRPYGGGPGMLMMVMVINASCDCAPDADAPFY